MVLQHINFYSYLLLHMKEITVLRRDTALGNAVFYPFETHFCGVLCVIYTGWMLKLKFVIEICVNTNKCRNTADANHNGWQKN